MPYIDSHPKLTAIDGCVYTLPMHAAGRIYRVDISSILACPPKIPIHACATHSGLTDLWVTFAPVVSDAPNAERLSMGFIVTVSRR